MLGNTTCCVMLCAPVCVRACGGRASGACACVSASGLFHGAGQRVPGDSMCVCGRGRTFFCSAGCLAPGVPSCAWLHECVHLNLLYLLHTFDYDVEGVDECPCWLGPCSAHQRSGRMGTGKLKVSSGRTTQTCPEAWGDEVQMGMSVFINVHLVLKRRAFSGSKPHLKTCEVGVLILPLLQGARSLQRVLCYPSAKGRPGPVGKHPTRGDN